MAHDALSRVSVEVEAQSCKTCSVPCGAAANGTALQEYDIGPAQLCQVIGHTAPNHTTSHNDYACLLWKHPIIAEGSFLASFGQSHRLS